MGIRNNKQISEEELSLVSGGLSGRQQKGGQKHCPLCGSGDIETYRVGSGWRQRRMGRCRSCSYEAGWGNFV